MKPNVSDTESIKIKDPLQELKTRAGEEYDKVWTGFQSMKGLHPNYSGKMLIESFLLQKLEEAYKQGEKDGQASKNE